MDNFESCDLQVLEFSNSCSFGDCETCTLWNSHILIAAKLRNFFKSANFQSFAASNCEICEFGNFPIFQFYNLSNVPILGYLNFQSFKTLSTLTNFSNLIDETIVEKFHRGLELLTYLRQVICKYLAAYFLFSSLFFYSYSIAEGLISFDGSINKSAAKGVTGIIVLLIGRSCRVLYDFSFISSFILVD